MGLFSKIKTWFSKNEEPKMTSDVEEDVVSDVVEVSTEQYMLDVDYDSQNNYYRVRSKSGAYDCKIYKYAGDDNVKRVMMRRAVRKQYSKDTGCPYIEVREMLASNWMSVGNKS